MYKKCPSCLNNPGPLIIERLARVWLVTASLLTGALAGGTSEGGDESRALLIAFNLWIPFSAVYWFVVPWAVQQWVRPRDPALPWNWIEQARDRATNEILLQTATLHLVCFAVAYLALTAGRLGGPVTGAGVGGSVGLVLGLAAPAMLRRPTFRDLFTLYGFGLIGFGVSFLVVTAIMAMVNAVNQTPRFSPESE